MLLVLIFYYYYWGREIYWLFLEMWLIIMLSFNYLLDCIKLEEIVFFNLVLRVSIISFESIFFYDGEFYVYIVI